MTTLSVKWGKETHSVSVTAACASGAQIKAALAAATGVPATRQKVMSKAWKGVLADDADVLAGCLALAPTAPVPATLMGSAEAGVSRPSGATQPVFVEDMKQSDIVRAGAVLPPGLRNEENTCFANATLEALRFVPELNEALAGLRTRSGAAGEMEDRMAEQRRILASLGMGGPAAVGGGGNASAPVARSLARLLHDLEGSPVPVLPVSFLSSLRSSYPQFSERGSGGGFKQHDADEFFVSLTAALASELREHTPAVPALRPASGGSDSAPNVFDTLFGVELDTEYACAEAAGAEPSVTRREFQRKLVCNIEGGAGRTTQVNNIYEGISLALSGEVDKASAVLGRNATWTRTSRVASLPRYLCIQFMRFYWKQTPDSRDHAGVKCKMLRPVIFPADRLDLIDSCVTPLQAELRRLRAAAGAYAPLAGAGASAPAAAATADMDTDASASARAAADVAAGAPPFLGYGLPADFLGYYELFALVTHKGRSADSGHYIAWVRRSATGRRDPADAGKWLVFDDDNVGEVDTEYVTSHLKGGGDDHTAYLAFYRARAGGS